MGVFSQKCVCVGIWFTDIDKYFEKDCNSLHWMFLYIEVLPISKRLKVIILLMVYSSHCVFHFPWLLGKIAAFNMLTDYLDFFRYELYFSITFLFFFLPIYENFSYVRKFMPLPIIPVAVFVLHLPVTLWCFPLMTMNLKLTRITFSLMTFKSPVLLKNFPI